MIQLRIRVPGQPDAIVEVEGNELVIGRSNECDAALPLPYVSKRHAKVMTGVVVCDVGSRNGVWVGGRKLDEAALLVGGKFLLGADAGKSPEVEVLRALSGDTQDGSFAALEIERRTLLARVAELEARLAAAAGEDATLASDALDPVGSALAPPSAGRDARVQPPPPAPRAPAHPLAGTPAGAQPSPTSPALPIVESGPEPSGEPARESAPETGPASPHAPDRLPEPTPPHGAKPGRVPSFAEFFGGARREVRPAQPPEPERKGRGAAAAPAPAVPASVPAFVRDQQRQRIVEMIDRLIAEDVGDRAPMIEGAVDEFFTLESFRLLRKVEQVITYLARDMVQLYDVKTMLPSSEGNFRSLAAEVLLDPEDRVARQRLVEYLEHLRKWLSVALTANRKAAQQVIRDLKKELSAEALAASEPMPALAKAFGRAETELWKRAQVHLRELTDDVVDEKVELEARKIAGEMLEPRTPN